MCAREATVSPRERRPPETPEQLLYPSQENMDQELKTDCCVLIGPCGQHDGWSPSSSVSGKSFLCSVCHDVKSMLHFGVDRHLIIWCLVVCRVPAKGPMLYHGHASTTRWPQPACSAGDLQRQVIWGLPTERLTLEQVPTRPAMGHPSSKGMSHDWRMGSRGPPSDEDPRATR